MKTVFVNSKKRIFPSEWSDILMVKKDFYHIIPLFFKGYTRYELLMHATFHYLKLPKYLTMQIAQQFRENQAEIATEEIGAEIYCAMDLLKFIADTKLKIEINIIPSLWIGFKKYVNTSNILRDFTVMEFALAEKSIKAFAINQNEDYLNELISIWYRPKNWFTKLEDKRIKFNDAEIESRKKIMASVSMPLKHVIYLYFISLRENIIKDFPNIFKTSNKKNDDSSWLDVIMSLSQPGEEDMIAQTNLGTVLERLEYNFKNSEKTKS